MENKNRLVNLIYVRKVLTNNKHVTFFNKNLYKFNKKNINKSYKSLTDFFDFKYEEIKTNLYKTQLEYIRFVGGDIYKLFDFIEKKMSNKTNKYKLFVIISVANNNKIEYNKEDINFIKDYLEIKD